jgi:hypothetical protein
MCNAITIITTNNNQFKMAASTEFIALTDTLMGLADDLLEHPITDGEYKILVEGIARIRILYEREHGALPIFVPPEAPPPNPVPLAASNVVLTPEIVETPTRDMPVFDLNEALMDFSIIEEDEHYMRSISLWRDGLITHGRGITPRTDTLNRSYEIVRSDIDIELINPRTNAFVEYKLIFERKWCNASRRQKMLGRVNRHPTKILVMMTNTYEIGTRYALINKGEPIPLATRGITITEVDYSTAVRSVGRTGHA